MRWRTGPDPIRSFAAQRRAFGLCREAGGRLQALFFMRGASVTGECKVFRQPPAGIFHRRTPARPGHKRSPSPLQRNSLGTGRCTNAQRAFPLISRNLRDESESPPTWRASCQALPITACADAMLPGRRNRGRQGRACRARGPAAKPRCSHGRSPTAGMRHQSAP